MLNYKSMSQVSENQISNSDNLEMPSFIRLKHPNKDETTLYPMDFEQAELDDAVRYQAEDSDIFVCSYPKCGTTWLQNIAWLIVHNGEPIPNKIRHSMPMLEFDGATVAEKIDNTVYPRIIKSHLPQSWVPYNENAKYLYITRNPKDSLISFFYHCRSFKEHYGCPDLKFDSLLDLYVHGEVEFGSYFQHVSDWYSKRDDPNVLFLLYEDLKSDVKTQVLKVGKFLGDKYEKALLANNGKLLDTVVEFSSLKSMKSQEHKWSLSPRDDKQPFIRKGQIGDWKNHMSPEQATAIDKRIKEMGGASGWSSLWDDHKDVYY